MHRQAVALVAAIAASFAYSLVDDDPKCRGVDAVALAVATFLGGAALVVNQDGAARHGGQDFLRFDQTVATPDLDADRHLDASIAVEFVGSDDDLASALGLQHLAQRGHIQLAERVLTASHRDRAVVEDLVGDVGAVGDGRPDCSHSAVEQGAVAQVLDEMVVVHKRCDTEPLSALVAHRGEADDVAGAAGLHHHHHAVAADSGADQ